MPNCIVTDKEVPPSLIAWQTISDAFAFLAAILNNPPNEEMIAELRKRSHEVELPLQKESGSYHLIAGYLNNSKYKPAATLAQELLVEWTRLFRGISPVYGPQPPYAGVYSSEDGVGVNTIMAITQMYSAHGLGIREDKHNRMDYLGTQLDFISILTKRAAQEAKSGNLEAEEAIRTDILDFLQNYLLPWVDEYVDKAREYAKTDFFTGYLVLLCESLNELAIQIRQREDSLVTLRTR